MIAYAASCLLAVGLVAGLVVALLAAAEAGALFHAAGMARVKRGRP